MKYLGSSLKTRGEIGRIIWACAYELNKNGDGRKLYQPPICGALMCGNTQSSHDNNCRRGYTTPSYFVPFCKNNTKCNFSKAVTIESRCYADNKEECIDLYKALIQNEINKYEHILKVLKDDIDKVK